MGLLCAAALAAAAVIAAISAGRARALRERFPPLTDEEFLARCRPGTNPAVALKVRRTIAAYFAIECARVHPEMTFVDDLGAD